VVGGVGAVVSSIIIAVSVKYSVLFLAPDEPPGEQPVNVIIQLPANAGQTRPPKTDPPVRTEPPPTATNTPPRAAPSTGQRGRNR
jgi:hypothetical protein